MFRTARRALALSLVGGLVPATASLADFPTTTMSSSTTSSSTTTSATTTTTSSTTTTTTSAPKPKSGHAKLTLLDAFQVQGKPVTVAGRGLHLQGVVQPYVPHQVVTLQVRLNGRLIRQVRLGVRSIHAGHLGLFTARIASPHAGTMTVTAIHPRSSAQSRFTAAARLAALSPHAGFGSSGRFVVLIQQRLEALHIFVPHSGVYDAGTGWALDAYHRLLGRGTSQSLGPATVRALLNGDGRFHIRFPRQGHHAEGNLGQQLLAIADGSRVDWIFPISSGKPSTPTILGNFRIYSRVPGYLPDGMYYSSFFIGGYAIHGFDPAPDYPASHGCMRVPIADAIFIYNHVNYGQWVDTYY